MKRTTTDEVKHGVIRWIVKGIVYAIIFGYALFATSGDWGWTQAWLYLAIYVVNQVILTLVLSPDLLSERSTAQEGSKAWDVPLTMVAAVLMPIATYAVAGLDRGNGWTANLSPALQIVALIVMVLGIALSSWAMTANKFFSGLVRIQEDRGHTVETGGPYRFVRHPGYVGGILHHIAAPLMLGSWWALIPGGIGVLLFVIRTALEDKTLQEELPGYVKFTQQTRYRLVPGIW